MECFSIDSMPGREVTPPTFWLFLFECPRTIQIYMAERKASGFELLTFGFVSSC